MSELDKPVESQITNVFDAEFPDVPTVVPQVQDPMDITSGIQPSHLTIPEQQQQQETDEHQSPEDKESAEILNEIVEERRQVRVCQRFIERHRTDYVPSEISQQLIWSYLEEHKLPITDYNLERAFSSLCGTAPASLDQAQPQFAQPQPQAPQKSFSTGLSDRPGDGSYQPVDANSIEAVSARIAKMGLEGARLAMVHAMARARGQGKQ